LPNCPRRRCTLASHTFKHALTHEVAYGGLLQERRRVLHARIVEALEVLAGERVAEQVERLAHHALRGEVWDKAVAYCRQAGAQALAHSAYQEAVGSFEQALAALRHLPASRNTHEQAIDLHRDLRLAYLPLVDMTHILAHLREAETLAGTLGDQRRLGSISAAMAQYLSHTGEHDRALAAGLRAVAIATALGDFTLQIEAHSWLGVVYKALGDYHRALECFGRAVASIPGERLYERFALGGLPSVQCRAGLVECLAEQGRFTEGSTCIDEAVRIAERVDHTISLLHAYFGVGFLSLRQGDLPKAIPVLERGLSLCQSRQAPAFFARFTSVLGAAYALAGRSVETLPLLEQAVEYSASTGWLDRYSLWLIHFGEAQLLAGRIAEATRLAERAIEHARTHKERGHEAWALRLLSEIHAHRDPSAVEVVEEYYRQALSLTNELEMRPLQAHCHRGLGTLYSRMGRVEPARAELSTAITLYRAMDMTFWLPQAEAALAQVP